MDVRNLSKTLPLSGALALALALALAVGCGGVSQEEYDDLQSQLSSEQQKGTDLQQQLSAQLAAASQLEQQIAAREGDVSDLEEELAAMEQEIADLQAQVEAGTGLPAGSSILLAAKPVPPPPPRDTPTPVPEGYVPPPPPTPPASYFAPIQLYIHADTVTSGAGESPYNYDAAGIDAPLCVPTGVFRRGMHLVWRYEIIDATTGRRLTSEDVETAVVTLPTGEEIKGRYGRHGRTEDSPWFWTSAWDVPLDYPLGVLDWSIDVTSNDGKTGSFEMWSVSFPDRGIESRTQIIQ